MDAPQNIKAKLKNADPELKQFVSRLIQHNKRIQSKLVTLEADKVSDKHKISSLEKKLSDELKKKKITVQIVKFDEKTFGLTSQSNQREKRP